jgi:hypothetical protein
MVAASHHRSKDWERLVVNPGDGLASRVLSLGGSVALKNYALESGSSQHLIEVFAGGEAGYAMLGVPIYRNDEVVGVLYGGLRRPEYIGDRGRLGLHNVAKLFAATLSTQEVTDRLKREGRAETGGALASSSESTVREYPNPTSGRSTDAVLLTVREPEARSRPRRLRLGCQARGQPPGGA